MLSFFLKYRKQVHYFLLGSLFLLSLLLVILGYTEYKMNAISRQLKSQKYKDVLLRHSYLALIKSQSDFNTFLKSQKGFDTYIYSLQKVDSAFNIITGDVSFSNEKLLQDKNAFHHLLQTISFYKPSQPKTEYTIPSFNFKDVLNSIQVESSLKVDSVAKRGLFSRLGDALKGNVPIQKEQLDVVVTMKYGKKIIPGTIEEQLSNAFKASSGFYSKAISDLEGHYNALYQSNQVLIDLHGELLEKGNILFDTYESILVDYEQHLESEYNDYSYQSTFLRSIIVIFLLLVVLFSLVFITKIAYDYEAKLKWLNTQNTKHLLFKNRILGLLSHELRSPLKIVSILLHKTLPSIKDENIKTNLKAVDFTVSSLLLQSNQILEYTKDSEKRNELILFDFDLQKELQKILESIRELVENNENELIVDNCLNEAIWVTSDKVKLQQLFLNIIGNANKFTKKGSISVTISMEQKELNSIQLHTMIKDTGVGISKNDLEKIFEPHYQGVLSRDIENLGAGLGLNLCKEIVTLFEGDIFVYSKKNKGTSVVFDIKLKLANRNRNGK